MLWVHPIIQLVATALGVYAAYLGGERFLAQHLGWRTQFLWKRHVQFGYLSMGIWGMGLISGFAVAKIHWQVNFITGGHVDTALAMIPFMVFGVLSGIYMDRRKAKRTLLPLCHGLCNLITLCMALYQIRTGWHVINDFIL